MEVTATNVSFGGEQRVYRHASESLSCAMNVGVYLPAQALAGAPCPVVYFLSGLTCTEQNVVTKGGYQAHAAAHGLIVVCPDTSPRGEDVADDAGWDLGQGAGFYLDATQAPWARHYQMETYLTAELPTLIDGHFNTTGAVGLTGHSMGGHGALTLYLRHPGRYQSVSAFSPIVAPSHVPWGHKAFAAYLGADRAAWRAHDACELVADFTGPRAPILVDQGDADGFLAEQLQPERFVQACEAAGHPLELRLQPGYDHSYYFIATFMGDHLRHHARALGG